MQKVALVRLELIKTFLPLQVLYSKHSSVEGHPDFVEDVTLKIKRFCGMSVPFLGRRKVDSGNAAPETASYCRWPCAPRPVPSAWPSTAA